MSLWRKALAITQFLLVLWCWLLLSLYLVFKLCEREMMVGVLPEVIEPGRVLLIAGESGFREGCGAAIFTLSASTAQQVREGGLSFLAQAQQARANADSYDHFEPWQATPQEGGSEGVLGLSCAEPDDALLQRISRAMNSPGSFYANKPEGVLLVLPAEGLIVFAYFG